MSKILIGPVLGIESEELYTFCVLTNKSATKVEFSINGNLVAAENISTTCSGIFWRAEYRAGPNDQGRFINYSVNIDGSVTENRSSMSSWQFYIPGEPESPKFAYTSCNGFSDEGLKEKTSDPYYLWDDMVAKHFKSPFSLLLMGGDQLYADSIWGQVKKLSEWSNLSRKNKTTRKASKEMDRQIENFYDQLYQSRWSNPSMALMLASIPSVMMWDDHDIFDGWGSYPTDIQDCDVYKCIYKHAKKHFELFQIRSKNNHSLLNPDSSHYVFSFSFHGYQVLAIDNRSERTINQVMSSTQWNDINKSLNETTINHELLLLTAVPVVYRDFSFTEGTFDHTPWEEELTDDLKDHWRAKEHQGERARLIMRLLDNAKNRFWIILTLFLYALIVTNTAYAACKPAKSTWNDNDQWAWKQICQSKSVNFNSKLSHQADIDNKSDWDKSRLLSANFIHDILLDKLYYNLIPPYGVRLSGFWINENIDLSNATIAPLVWFDHGRFEKSFEALETTFQHTMTFDGSHIEGELSLNRSAFEGRISINDAKILGKVQIEDSHIYHDISLLRSTFNDDVSFAGTTLEKNLLIYESVFAKELRIRSTLKGRLEVGDSVINSDFDLISADITQMFVTNTSFKGVVRFNHMTSSSSISIMGKNNFYSEAIFDFDDIRDFNISASNTFNDNVLISGRIRNDLDLGTSNDDATLDVNSDAYLNFNKELHIAFLHAGELNVDFVLIKEKVSLIDIKANNLRINGAIFYNDVIGNLINVDFNTMVFNSTFHKTTKLRNLHSGNHIQLKKISSLGELDISSLSAGGNAWLIDSIYTGPVNLSYSTIIGNLILDGSTFSTLDLTSSKISETLSLWSEDTAKTNWIDTEEIKSSLTLYNTKVHLLREHPCAWPTNINLIYFSYDQIIGPDTKISTKNRPTDWYLNWLEKNAHKYHPQPYMQLESVFKNSGRIADSNKIQYQREERKRLDLTYDMFEFYWLTAMKWLTGYGQSIGHMLIAFSSLVLAGVLVFRRYNETHNHDVHLGFKYSLELALPIVPFSKEYKDIILHGFPRYWSYFQVLAGYVLITMVIGSIIALYK